MFFPIDLPDILIFFRSEGIAVTLHGHRTGESVLQGETWCGGLVVKVVIDVVDSDIDMFQIRSNSIHIFDDTVVGLATNYQFQFFIISPKLSFVVLAVGHLLTGKPAVEFIILAVGIIDTAHTSIKDTVLSFTT